VSANVPALLIVLMPVNNSRLEPLCTRNIQSALNSIKHKNLQKMTVDECRKFK